MASIKLRGDTSGELVIEAPAVAGTNTLTLPAASGNILTDAAALPAIDGSALTGIPSLGVGQTWQNLTASRSAGVTYTNTTGKPIFISLKLYIAYVTNPTILVDGVAITGWSSNASQTNYQPFSFIVPNNSTYSVSTGLSASATWYELR